MEKSQKKVGKKSEKKIGKKSLNYFFGRAKSEKMPKKSHKKVVTGGQNDPRGGFDPLPRFL